TIDLRATDLSRDSGHAALSVEAEHVRGAIEGDAKQGVFHAADGARITVMHISKDISERYIETVLPFLTRFEKTAQDDPAEFTADGLTIPLGNDMTKLNGRVRMDLGTVQFSTSTLFGDILDATNNNRTGSLGGRVDPILLTIDKGVLSYERTKIPTGSYVMETRGTIDLVKQKMEIILYLPLSALSKDLRNAFGRVPGLDDFGLVPIRIKGALNKPKIEPALDLVLEEGVPELIDRVLEDVLKDTLDDLFNPGKNNR
ncbi:hypothetical protein JYT11_00760, partial [Planctomycetaceae bacterium AH-315-I19]|nr:hypothetical protein [Planctomycetaceae bacterium AH-315-I19]